MLRAGKVGGFPLFFKIGGVICPAIVECEGSLADHPSVILCIWRSHRVGLKSITKCANHKMFHVRIRTLTSCVSEQTISTLSGDTMSSAKVNAVISPALCLPTELFALIFSHLSLKDLGRARQACRLWADQATPFVWKEMDLTLSTLNWSNPFVPNYPGVLPNFRYTTVLSLNLLVDAWEPDSMKYDYVPVIPDGVDLVNRYLNQLQEINRFLPERMKYLELNFHTFLGIRGKTFFTDRVFRVFETLRDVLAKLTNPDTRKIDKVKVYFMGAWSRMYGQLNMNDLLLILKRCITGMDVEVASLDSHCLLYKLPTLKEVTIRDSPPPMRSIPQETWNEVSWSLNKLTLKYNHSVIPSLPKLADTLTQLNIYQNQFSWKPFQMGFFQFSNLEYLRIHSLKERENWPVPDFLRKPLISTKLRSVTIYTCFPNHGPYEIYQHMKEQCPQLSSLTFCTHRLLGHVLRHARKKNPGKERCGPCISFEADDTLRAGGRSQENGIGPLGCFLRGSVGSNSIDYIFFDYPRRNAEAFDIWELKLTKRRPVHDDRFLKVNFERDSSINLTLCEGYQVGEEVKICQIGSETWDNLSDETRRNGFWELMPVYKDEFKGWNRYI